MREILKVDEQGRDVIHTPVGNVAYAINNRGDVLGRASGYCLCSQCDKRRPSKTSDPTGDRIYLTLSGATNDISDGCCAINNRGQVAGAKWIRWTDDPGYFDGTHQVREPVTHAALWERGNLRDLGTLGGEASTARGINDQGQIVGDSMDGKGITRAFLWERGSMHDLGPPSGSRLASAVAINNRCQVVGACQMASETHAALWKPGESYDLNALVHPPQGADWLLTEAADINDHGQIICRGRARGNDAAYLLTPR
jgi:probable HAF family extracellular repeat protein